MTTQIYQSCIAACLECAVECKNSINECLHEPEMYKLARCIKLHNDCAAICFLAMDAMGSDSEFVSQICALCEEVSKACATECENHVNMKFWQKCAEACRKCTEECSRIGNLKPANAFPLVPTVSGTKDNSNSPNGTFK